MNKDGHGLVCLFYILTFGISRTFCVMLDHTFLKLQITRLDIIPHISLVIAFNLLQGFVCVRMG